MDFKTLIKFLPLMGIIVGLLIGDQTRPAVFFAKIPFFELFQGFSSELISEQRIAKDQLMHVGIYGVVGGVLGFVLQVVLQKKTSKEN
ncbi:hypothetical protein [Kordiimonas pumila]|uniref:Uncharacterized protein n=1 Tax=Kordiimonas pumila TaxID=2161677 RepID=A0ABV7D523_9PROT|nr:hypothetical protein [Kordiimonas pumila]